MDLIIKNGNVVTSKETIQADLYIKDGKIVDIKQRFEENNDSAKKIIDASNMLVMPGGVDVHTHLDMPFMGTNSSDDFETGTIAAALGGTTSIIDYVVPGRWDTIKESVRKWHRKAEKKAVIDYGFHVAAVPSVSKIIKSFDFLVESGITSIKCFLAYKDSLMINDTELFELLVEAKKHRILVCVHAENGDVIDFLTKKYLKEGKTEPISHALSRPPELEGESVGKVIKFAKLSRTPVYFVHLSTKDAMQEIKAAKKNNQNVFAETCPQYLLLTENKYFEKNFEGAKYVMSPPLRKYKHCTALKKGITKGYIDTIATDHCPFDFSTQKQKGLNDFTKIPNGAPGIETRMPIMFNEMVVKMGMDPSKFVELNCTNPAKIFGMKKKGDIKIDNDADIVIWNPDKIWKIKNEKLHQNVDYTPFEDCVVTGKPITVISRGEVIAEKGKITATPGRGEFIKRKVSGPAYS